MKVSFVVPCYRLAHVLPECLESILKQSYRDFEILIMDDCSPDDTPAVAAAFTDPRVVHVRNPVNLGHLRNYNAGIARARGEYVWLISADDTLRSPDVLRQFVEILDRNPPVGFAFCQAMKVSEGRDLGAYPRTAPAGITSGHQFLRTLLDYNCVPAAGAMARKSCYVRAGMFPTDLPYAGDWYIWCAFALHADVAYVPEPMVNYRQHDLSMTTYFNAKTQALIQDEVAVRWRIKGMAEAAGFWKVTAACRQAIAEDYTRRLAAREPNPAVFPLTSEAVEASIETLAGSPRRRARTRADVLECRGDDARAAGRLSMARELYGTALRRDPVRPLTWIKYGAVVMGGLTTSRLTQS